MSKLDERRQFKQWAVEWQASGTRSVESAEQIRHYVKKRGGLVWSFVVTDFIIGGVALPILVYLGVATDNDAQRLAMIALGSITVGAIGFGWWNWRGVLRASASSVSEYVAISAERLRRMRLAWRIAWVVLAAQIVVYVLWIPTQLHNGDAPPSPGQLRFAWGWLFGFVLAAVAGLLWFGRWLKRDAARFEALRRELE